MWKVFSMHGYVVCVCVCVGYYDMDMGNRYLQPLASLSPSPLPLTPPLLNTPIVLSLCSVASADLALRSRKECKSGGFTSRRNTSHSGYAHPPLSVEQRQRHKCGCFEDLFSPFS